LKELQRAFNYQGRQVRTILIDGEPWWVAKDVCEIFGDTNYRRSVSRLDDDEKGVSQINTPGGPQQMTIVNEPGLYTLLFYMQPQKGNLPEEKIQERTAALKSFKRWVTHEVIPSIRKTGAYATTLDELHKMYPSIPRTYPEALRQLADREEKLIKQAPLVSFAETCAASKDSVLIRELAKIASKNGIIIGEKRLYQRLRTWGLIFPYSTEPYQEYVDRGYFEVTQSNKEVISGVVKLFKVTRVTPKGQIYILDRLRKEVLNLSENIK